MPCSLCREVGHNARSCAKKAPTQSSAESIKMPRPADIVRGSEMTKEWRQSQFGVVSGGGGTTKIEAWQRAKLEEGLGVACRKTDVRINKRTGEMRENKQPMKHDDGFDWTENFDGVSTVGARTLYISFKSVVGRGGAQTRTLRDECAPFVEEQLKQTQPNVLFLNILDGDEALRTLPKFAHIQRFYPDAKHVYVGDLYGVFEWIQERIR